MVTLNSSQTLELRTGKSVDQPRISKPSASLTYVKTLRFPVPYGEPYKRSESGCGLDVLGEAHYLGRVLGILVSDRVDLSVSGTLVKVGLQEGLDVGIGAIETNVRTVRLGLKSEGTHAIGWL